MEKKPLKIVFLSRFSGQVERGVETYVQELAKRLARNYQVDIFFGKDADNLSKVINGHYDLVVATNGRFQALKFSLGRILGKYKLIIPGQAGIGRDDLWNIAVACPDVYAALTDFEKDWAKKWAWRTKVVKIPNGVDLNNFSPHGEKIYFDLPKPVILSVGALEWYKYHERTIKAVSVLGKGSLLIIGKGKEEEKLKDLGRRCLGEERFLITKTSFAEIAKYYRSADLFTLPSWIRESFGIVYVEAMASGLAVVAPDDPPRREIVGMGGVFTDVSNPQKYAQAINQALNISWKDLPRKQAEKYSWDLVADQYQRLIKEMF